MILDYTILHISDLHKNQNCDYDNLFMSLCIDCNQYTAEGIKKPSIIVVSGDLIEGSKNPNKDKAIEDIRKQYSEVRIFLQKLVDYFLDGDKGRMIIVPGNHDVCQTISANAMRKDTAPINESEAISKRKDLSTKKNRWCWKDLSYYSINDVNAYKSRFDLFVEFYNGFFEALTPKRSWEVPCEFHSQLVDLPQYNICFLEFNSCCNLDHLNDSGEIYPKALSIHQDRIAQISNRGSLLVGVWHHHTSGLPHESNYLDHRILQSMIGSGLKIGLYGHQHLPSVMNEYHDLNQKKKILLVSSGSLYGERKQLVTGCPRQYCLISLNFSDGKVDFKLHVRKDTSNFDIPNWTEGQIGNSASTEISQSILLKPLNITKFISEIDDFAQTTKDYEQAYLRMKLISQFNPDACSVFLDKYLRLIKNPNFFIEHINQPSSDSEYTYLLKAVVDKKDKELLSELIKDNRFSNLKGALMNFLREESDKLLRK